jgi:hypothetical protein
MGLSRHILGVPFRICYKVGMGFSLPKILEGLGVGGGDDVRHVKLAPGVVGHTTTAVVVAAVVIAAEVYFLRSVPWAMAVAVGATVFVVTVYLVGTWRFADKHPDLALMGGSELLQLRQLQIGAQFKDLVVKDQRPQLGGGAAQMMVPGDDQ